MGRITKEEFPDLFKGEEEEIRSGFGSNDPGVQQQFGWYYVLDQISGGDILKHGQVLDLPFKRILFHMVYLTKSSEKKHI